MFLRKLGCIGWNDLGLVIRIITAVVLIQTGDVDAVAVSLLGIENALVDLGHVEAILHSGAEEHVERGIGEPGSCIAASAGEGPSIKDSILCRDKVVARTSSWYDLDAADGRDRPCISSGQGQGKYDHYQDRSEWWTVS